MIKTSLILLLLCNHLLSIAQNSYVYIEGIKGIPFNVLSENKEVAKLGKSYSIITYSEPGEKKIDITFLNSNFEKQQFVVDVQANSSYGFRLGKTEENRFYLIDIVNEGKIIETNSKVDLALSTEKNIINTFLPVDIVSQLDLNESEGKGNNDIIKKEKRKERKKKVEEIKPTSIDTVEQEPEPVKYGVTEVIAGSENVTEKKESQFTEIKSQSPTSESITPNIVKTNCSKIASDEEVKSILEKIQLKGDDEDKLLFIKKRVVSGCFTSKHIFLIAEKFDTQYGRYSLAKFVVPLTSDPINLLNLESLFKYEAYKSKLRKLIEN